MVFKSGDFHKRANWFVAIEIGSAAGLPENRGSDEMPWKHCSCCGDAVAAWTERQEEKRTNWTNRLRQRLGLSGWFFDGHTLEMGGWGNRSSSRMTSEG